MKVGVLYFMNSNTEFPFFFKCGFSNNDILGVPMRRLGLFGFGND